MSTLTDRQKDRCVHNVPPHGVADTDNVQIGQQTKTLQDFFFLLYQAFELYFQINDLENKQKKLCC